MRTLRPAAALLLGVCLLLLSSLAPACAHEISEPGLCAAQCVMSDLGGHAAALTLALPDATPLAVAPGRAAAGGDAEPLDVVAGDASPRAPPLH